MYGPNEAAFLPRMMLCIEDVMMGYVGVHRDEAQLDWLHVDNAAHAVIRALNMLASKESAGKVTGQVFNINDGVPNSSLMFVRPFFLAMTGKEYRPPFQLPIWLFIFIGHVFAVLSLVFGKRFRLPFWGYTLMEALKVCSYADYGV